MDKHSEAYGHSSKKDVDRQWRHGKQHRYIEKPRHYDDTHSRSVNRDKERRLYEGVKEARDSKKHRGNGREGH